MIPIQYKLLAILALIAAIYALGYSEGSSDTEAVYTNAALEKTVDTVKKHNVHVVENKKAAIITAEKKSDVQKILWKYQTKYIESECNTTDVISLYINPAISEANTIIQ